MKKYFPNAKIMNYIPINMNKSVYKIPQHGNKQLNFEGKKIVSRRFV